MRGWYVLLPFVWPSFEVCRGCYVNLPLCLTCIGSRLTKNPFTGWWTVAMTEWVARAAMFLLHDVYDQYRLWRIPPPLWKSIQDPDLTVPPGGNANLSELISIWRGIESVDRN